MYQEKIETVNTPRIEKSIVLHDYYIACLSRNLSLAGRKEVHNGKAHFGIFGDGKELAQIAYAKTFRKGDWRSGYYRDQTFMLALGLLQPDEFFSMIYGDTDESMNPSTGGRNFNNHFSTRNIDVDGRMHNHSQKYNSASDISPTAGQLPRLLGLAQATKIARQRPDLIPHLNHNVTGNEVAFGSIGDASTSEGFFFETVNAACVMELPLAIAIYDDGYGISVPIEKQTTKASISEALAGFQKNEKGNGALIYTCRGWDYPALVKTFDEGIKICREQHVPVIFHITEVTQPTGHSTSGSHERYKSKERLEWEKQFDPITRFRQWLLQNGISTDELQRIENKAHNDTHDARENAWTNFTGGFEKEKLDLTRIIDELYGISAGRINHKPEFDQITGKIFPTRRSYLSLAKRMHYELHNDSQYTKQKSELSQWIAHFESRSFNFYNHHVYREGTDSALFVEPVYPIFTDNSKEVNGYEILNANFDKLFQKYPTMVTFGEDTGKLGDVNQGMKGMQAQYGEERVSDTGIREATIVGQGIGLAMRGFRPIAEIQYLDYLIYALSQLSDDLASLQYRTKGKQAAPLIVRTRGHQLQGIWHAGSPMMMLLGALRGMYLCVPRNMVQAAGMYNTLLAANDPALVIEPLKGYNVKERMPENPGEYKIPLGVTETVLEGTDITIVTYGWNVYHAVKAAKLLDEFGVSTEVIDVQTLLPFDIHHSIVKSIQKTNKILFLDEDVPGGATAYMMQKVLEEQRAFDYLETMPRTLSAHEHRPAYGIDGEYFSKPNVEQIFETVHQMMLETDTKKFKQL
jgi:pyruvate/2-oxoglutarate/acetoin dehydrogenase E1 component/TPP-dependent pyruvate/acetoin dehydrogenase alpha subunit